MHLGADASCSIHGRPTQEGVRWSAKSESNKRSSNARRVQKEAAFLRTHRINLRSITLSNGESKSHTSLILIDPARSRKKKKENKFADGLSGRRLLCAAT